MALPNWQKRDWVDVPLGTTAPAGAPARDAAWHTGLDDYLAQIPGAVDEAHTRVICTSITRPTSPPKGLVIYEVDTGRELVNEGDATTPVWVDRLVSKLTTADLVSDYAVSGLLPTAPSPASRTMETPAGTAYAGGNRIEKAAESATYAKASDTYVDLDSAGAYLYSAIANGAAAPALAAGSVRLFRAATDADVAQVETVTVATIANSTVYTVTINGVGVSYASDADATAGEIALGLVAAVNNSTDANVSVVTAATSAVATSTTASLTLTADTAGVAFTVTVDASLTRSTTDASNISKITVVTDLRITSPTVRGALGPHSLLGHSDADQAAIPADGDTLVYDQAASLWKPGSGGGASYEIAEFEIRGPLSLGIQPFRWYAPRALEVIGLIVNIGTRADQYSEVAILKGRGDGDGTSGDDAPLSIMGTYDAYLPSSIPYNYYEAALYATEEVLPPGTTLRPRDNSVSSNLGKPDFLALQVTTVGTTNPGADLRVQVICAG